MSPKRELPKAQFRPPRSPNEPQITEDIFFGEIITKFYVLQDNFAFIAAHNCDVDTKEWHISHHTIASYLFAQIARHGKQLLSS